MKNRKKQETEIIIKTPLIFLLLTLFMASSCGQNSNHAEKITATQETAFDNKISENKYKVTFVELGSVRCIPCQQMQKVMKSIETKYSKEVKIEFHDVWTEAGKPFGLKYGIDAIPTQVFLDETGKEYYRHVGFFPEEELVKILQQKGVKLN
jgi:thioredoxin 1